MDDIDPKEGDFFEGVLLETFRDGYVSRPRVRPVDVLPGWLKVEFPRHLREENPIGTRFRADVHVRQKHHGDGTPNGPLYLRAENHTIFRVKQPDFEKLVFARQQPGTISGRAYEYFSIKTAPKSAAERLDEGAASRSIYRILVATGVSSSTDKVSNKTLSVLRRSKRKVNEYASRLTWRITAPRNLIATAHIFVRLDESYGWKPRSSRFFRAQASKTWPEGSDPRGIQS
ncbi:hypothetical protein [Bradyrhizobium sp. Arg816]|uniref:hypothetical protein n=1 Tax=Bradyrhizobium sp. Arg816 TaxID=2998491 RepID=UPI00249DDF09|nr:hypothetical protein [Bradyrhizobium sp. Arg816]MDI3561739.1 hypothetical protein [Bradyrhizobium sp. Arg816]